MRIMNLKWQLGETRWCEAVYYLPFGSFHSSTFCAHLMRRWGTKVSRFRTENQFKQSTRLWAPRADGDDLTRRHSLLTTRTVMKKKTRIWSSRQSSVPVRRSEYVYSCCSPDVRFHCSLSFHEISLCWVCCSCRVEFICPSQAKWESLHWGVSHSGSPL